MKKLTFLEFFSIYLFGGIGYGAIETAWRGYTHWTMIVAGGVCACLIHMIATRMHERLWKKWIMCAACITAVEFVAGCIVNLRLGWNVWDYSSQPLDLMGQICPMFTLAWLALSVPCVEISILLKKYVFVNPK